MYMNASNSCITEERADTSLAIIAQPSLPPLSMAMLAGLVPDPRPTTLRLRLGDTDAGVIDLIPDQYAVVPVEVLRLLQHPVFPAVF